MFEFYRQIESYIIILRTINERKKNINMCIFKFVMLKILSMPFAI